MFLCHCMVLRCHWGRIGSISGVAAVATESDVPAMTVPWFSFSFSVFSNSEVFLVISRVLVGHGVASTSFLTSV